MHHPSAKADTLPKAESCALAAMAFGVSTLESQWDSGSKPRVARNELPWEKAPESDNPNGVVAWRRKRATTPLGLKMRFAKRNHG